MAKGIHRWIGDRAFYKMVLAVAVPIMIQQGITNFVGLLDNIMVGQIGTEQMSGVSITNQIMMVYNLCVFGGISGAGIFGAQFYGSGDMEGVRNTFRFKLYVVTLVTLLGLLIFGFYGDELISLYLTDTGDGVADVKATLRYGRNYLNVMMIGIFPFALAQVYATTLRETGQTTLPMVSGIAAVLINLILNYILIFGHFGAPAMGAVGAAVGTVVSRFAELGIMVVVSHKHTDTFRFAKGIYRTLKVPGSLAKSIFVMGAPLLVNEFFWSAGMAAITQSYSYRGLVAVAALNISSTVTNLFNVVFYAMGNAVAIIVGQKLGSGDIEDAKQTDHKLIFFACAMCVGMGALLAAVSPFIPKIYNTADSVRELATLLICVSAVLMPMNACNNSCYFTLRSGGKTWVTLLFDSVFVCCISFPLSWVLSHLTGLPIVLVVFLVQLADIIKMSFGLYLVARGKWAENLVQ